MSKEKLVVIGNGMAGIRTLEELLKLTTDQYEITVIGAEPHPNYNRIMLSPVLAGEKQLEDIILNDRNWYEENSIKLLTGDPVVKIDRTRQQVTTQKNEVLDYDRLLLATGSNPFIIPVPGHDKEGVIGFRDIAEAVVLHGHRRYVGYVATCLEVGRRGWPGGRSLGCEDSRQV